VLERGKTELVEIGYPMTTITFCPEFILCKMLDNILLRGQNYIYIHTKGGPGGDEAACAGGRIRSPNSITAVGNNRPVRHGY
jgi:hypothetical protein